MRIVFVDNLLLERSGGLYDYVLQPHLGLISLIAVVEAAGHEGVLYDPKLAVARGGLTLDASLYRELACDILRSEPDVIGMTSLGCNFICTLKIARYLRELRPDLPILLGGPHATVLSREILERFSQFDLIVRNEAELKVIPVLNALTDRRFADVPGITYRQGGQVVSNPGEPVINDLDGLPSAAYGHYPIEALGLTWLRVEAGRGCPFLCTFCSTASFFGRSYRLKSSQRLCADLDRLHARYGITHFSLTHDLFTVNRKKVIDFCEHVAGRGYTWKCSARMDCVDSELLEIMAGAGCREIYYGVETGSRRMQKVAQKRLDLSLFTPTLDATDRVGMTSTVSFITGYPQEEKTDQEETLDLVGSCFYREPPPHYVQLHLLTPEPGTQLLAELEGALEYDGHVTDFNFPTLETDDAAIMRANPVIFVNHHYFPSVLPRRRNVFITSLYGGLYRLGPTVLVQILERYQGRLSRFVDSLEAWAEPRGIVEVDPEDLARFFRDAWGEEDWLTSLVRYKAAAIEIAKRVASGILEKRRGSGVPERTPWVPETRYRLKAETAVVRDLHDCPSLLERLSAARSKVREPGARIEIPSELYHRRAHYLLLAGPDDTALRNFELDSRSAALLESFREPRSIEEVASAARATEEEVEPVLGLCGELLRLGVITPVGPRSDRFRDVPERVARGKLAEWGEASSASSVKCHG